MKKVFAALLGGILALSLTACGQANVSVAETTTPATTAAATAAATFDEPIAGGYTDTTSPVLTAEQKAVFEKATATITGASYVPVAYVASQVVAGTNHLYICKATAGVPDAATTYALVTVYEDLDGNAEITDIRNSNAVAPEPAGDEPVDGEAFEPETPEVTPEAKDALKKATADRSEETYEPIALLAAQVVGGMNYGLLCKVTPAAPNADTPYAIVAVYAGSDGTAELIGTTGFDSTDEEPAARQVQAQSSEG